MGHVYVCIYGKYTFNIMLNQNGHISRESGKSRKNIRKQSMHHIYEYINMYFVYQYDARNRHATYTPHVSYHAFSNK